MRNIFSIYGSAASAASRSLIRNWLIIPASIVGFILFQLALTIVAPLGFIGGLIAGLILVALIGQIYSWLRFASHAARLKPRDLIEFDAEMFSTVLSAAFALWIIQIPITALNSNPESAMIGQAFSLLLFIVLNALPEIIYMRNASGLPALSHTLTFVRDFWIEWFLPYLIVICPLFFALQSGLAFLQLLASGNPLVPVLQIIQVPSVLLPTVPLLSIALGIVLAIWFMLFRAELFRRL